MNIAQCRGARAMLGLSQKALASRSGVGERTLVEFEKNQSRPLPRTLDALRRALESAGIEFIDDGAPGVRLIAGGEH